MGRHPLEDLPPPESAVGGPDLRGNPPTGCSAPGTKHIFRFTDTGSSGSRTESSSSSPRWDM
ncbi:hypothetical protein GCM10010439_17580 [Actinocorallia aurantiaca]|uniref:Uncharacterized protein n=1 Tax=Actinocorallia aurantiaca TaxID=46204 RepID=A0ABN3U216_9ACTN